MLDTFTHRWLKVPYTLHVRRDRRVKNPRATILFIHGIGNNGSVWDDVIDKLPDDLRVITIDLLGFGASPKPTWAIYNAKTQANSVIMTFFKLRIRQPVIIVGHSLGSLIAVEFATRYPLAVRSLVLCSPPFYRQDPTTRILLPAPDKVLKDVFTTIQHYPDQLIRVSALAVRYKLVNKTFDINDKNVHSYIGALRSSIVNQTSFDDAQRLTVRTRILHGTLDPVVVYKNLKLLKKSNTLISLTNTPAAHEIKGWYVDATVKAIDQAIKGE